MNNRIQLAEAQQLLLEQYVEDCLSGRVDYRTGEILGERAYASNAYLRFCRASMRLLVDPAVAVFSWLLLR